MRQAGRQPLRLINPLGDVCEENRRSWMSLTSANVRELDANVRVLGSASSRAWPNEVQTSFCLASAAGNTARQRLLLLRPRHPAGPLRPRETWRASAFCLLTGRAILRGRFGPGKHGASAPSAPNRPRYPAGPLRPRETWRVSAFCLLTGRAILRGRFGPGKHGASAPSAPNRPRYPAGPLRPRETWRVSA
jgi:hypothetical protein